MRLVDGDSEYEGLVEVCLSQRWGTVNGDGWSSVDTRVVCRQLGYPTEGYYGSTSAARTYFSTVTIINVYKMYIHVKNILCPDVSFSLSGHRNRVSTPIFMDTVACSGSESKLFSCTYHRDTSEDEHSEDIRVHCAQNTPDITNISQGSSSGNVALGLSIASLIFFSVLALCLIIIMACIVHNLCKRMNKYEYNEKRNKYELNER